MGREVKRVAVGFDWPLSRVWGGFINPFYSQKTDCPECDGSGSGPEAQRLNGQWYGYAPFKPEDRGSRPFLPTDEPVQRFAKRNVERSPEYYGVGDRDVMREAERLCQLWNRCWNHHLNANDVAALIEGNRLWDFTRHFVPGEGWKDNDTVVVPTPEQVNTWSISGGFGHDAVNQWIVIGAECKRLGIEPNCQRCEGTGEQWPSAEIKAAAYAWEHVQPPTGEGWQVWETVSEGSPVTPVFATREALIDYLVEGGDAWDQRRGNGGWTRENAESFVGKGWAPSAIGMVSAEGVRMHEPRDGGLA